VTSDTRNVSGTATRQRLLDGAQWGENTGVICIVIITLRNLKIKLLALFDTEQIIMCVLSSLVKTSQMKDNEAKLWVGSYV
jgi:hypothetical protein